MHIGILTARSPNYHPNRRLKEAAAGVGYRLSLIHPKHCLAEISSGRLGFIVGPCKSLPDVLLPRIGATIKDYALTLVRHFELAAVPVVNCFESILLARNKLFALQCLAKTGIPVPESYCISNPENFKWALSKLQGFPVVAKTPVSRQGKGVIMIENSATADFVLENLPTRFEGLVLQRYIPPEKRKDIRVFVVGSKVVGAMELVPRQGDFRSNFHLKSVGRKVRLHKELKALAVKSTKALRLEISGIDIILDLNGSPQVIEVNYSPGFKGLESSTGIDIASLIIDYVARRYGDRP
jgi:ribosomal protein S6--L-glutamate ligase